MSTFWSWFIALPVLLGLVACAWLVLGNARGAKGPQSGTMGHTWDGDLQELNNPLPRWWLNLFLLSIVSALIYLLLYPGLGAFKGLLGWKQVYQYEREVRAAEKLYAPLYARYAATEISKLADDREAMSAARRLYLNNCAQCHGSDARGFPGYPNLRDDDWLYGGAPETIKQTILDGRTGIMPPWGSALGEDGVAQTAAYVRALSGVAVDSAQAAAGKTHFMTFCAACHAQDGQGTAQLGAPNLRDTVWLYGSTQAQVEATIRDGRSGQMPAHRDRLGEQKSHLLAAYVWGLSRDQTLGAGESTQ